MPPGPDGASRGRISPLFTWRSAVASKGGPDDYSLLERTAAGESERIVKGSTQRHVALTLSLHMNERGGSCYPGIPRISYESALSDRAVQRALRALQQTEWLDVRIGEAPDGTNLYEATIPEEFELDEGVTRGHRVTPGRPNGDPGSPKGVTEDVNVPATQELSDVEVVVASWREHAPPLIQHRDSFFAAGKTKTALRAALKVYDAATVAAAVANYATVLGGSDYRWDYSWTLRDFLARGLDRFVPEADPLRNFRIRSEDGGRASREDFGDIADL